MDIHGLQAFVEVARRGSFSLAAEALHLTQPAISKRIRALETHLGVRLFDRIGHPIRLTEAGRALQPKAEGLLGDFVDLRRTLANLSREVSGPLSVGTSHHVGLHRLPPALRRFHRDYPDVHLDLQFMDSESACSAVEHGSLDLAIVTLPSAPGPKLDLTRIWHDPLEFVVCADHPLAVRPQHRLEDLLGHSAVLPARGTYTREILDREVARAGLRIEAKLETNYLETLKMLVSIGLGWSLLPRTLINQDLVRVHVEGLALSRSLGAVRHRGRTAPNAVRAMLNTCLEYSDRGGAATRHRITDAQ